MKKKRLVILLTVMATVITGPLMAAIPTPSGINPDTGSPWGPGDKYRLTFITSTNGTGLDGSGPGSPVGWTIDDFNAHVQALADAAGLDGANWYVIGSTSLVDARDNTMTNPDDPNQLSCPIYLIDGTTLVAVDNADLWDGQVAHIIDQTEYGVTKTHWPFTGSYLDGTKASDHPTSFANLGDDAANITQGQGNSTTAWIWRQWTGDPPDTGLPLYAMSEALTIGGQPKNPDPEDGATFEPPYGIGATGNEVVLSWTNVEPNSLDPVYVDVWFGTDPNKLNPLADYTKIIDATNLVGDVTSVTVNAPPDATYYWQVDSYSAGAGHINEPNLIEGPVWSFTSVSDNAPTPQILTPDQITWYGESVPVDATVIDDGHSPLTIAWSADPVEGVSVGFSPSDSVEDPTVTLTKVPVIIPFVNNPGFENPALDDGTSADTGSVPGWTTQYAAEGSGVWATDNTPNGGAMDPNTGDDYNGIAYEGENVGYVTTDVGFSHALYQSTSVVLESGKTYDLVASIGNPYVTNGNGSAPDYRLELVANGSVLAVASGASPLDDSSWITDTASYTALVSDPNDGNPLSIRLVAEAGGTVQTLNFDDIQLKVDGVAGTPDSSMRTVTVTLSASDVGNPTPVTDTMTNDVYETACEATIAGLGASAPDLDANCIVDLDDAVLFVETWLNDFNLAAPQHK